MGGIADWRTLHGEVVEARFVGFYYINVLPVGHVPFAPPACLWGKALFKLLVLSPYLVNLSRADLKWNQTCQVPSFLFVYLPQV